MGLFRANVLSGFVLVLVVAATAHGQLPLLMRDAAVQRQRYVAENPDPSEPLGFSGSHFDEGPSGAPVTGMLDESNFEFEDFDEGFDPDGPAPAVSSGTWVKSGCWYWQNSVVYMNRSPNTENEIRLATDVLSAAQPINRNFLGLPDDFDYEPGLRSTLGRFLYRDGRNRDYSVDFTFLGLLHWHDARGITAVVPGSIISNIDPIAGTPAFTNSNFQQFNQTTTFNSYEFNFRMDRRLARDRLVYTRDSTWVRQCTPAALPSLFAGVRVVVIDETLDYLATATNANGDYHIQTHNNMVGLQIGTDWFYEHCEWRGGVRLKGGSLVNWATQSSVVSVLGDDGAFVSPFRNEHAADHVLGFTGELTFIGSYQITPRLAFRASYDLMWVTNLALAQNQVTFLPSTPPDISVSHSLFFQGASIGLEFMH